MLKIILSILWVEGIVLSMRFGIGYMIAVLAISAWVALNYKEIMARIKKKTMVPEPTFGFGDLVRVMNKTRVHFGFAGTVKRILPDARSRYLVWFDNGNGGAFFGEGELALVERRSEKA